jgi:hypothetical protein
MYEWAEHLAESVPLPIGKPSDAGNWLLRERNIDLCYTCRFAGQGNRLVVNRIECMRHLANST